MEKFHPERTENIVEKVEKGIKPIDAVDFNASVERLGEVLTARTLSGPDHLEFDAGDFKYEIKTEELRRDDEAWSYNTKNTKVTTLVVEAGDTKIDLLALVKKPLKFYFEPAPYQTGFVSNLGEIIQVFGNKATLLFLLIALHEIGHLVDNEEIRNTPASKMMSFHEFAFEAEEIRRERDSSAFALAIFRSITKNPQKRRDAVNFLKHDGLAGYYEAMREKMHKKKNLPKNGGDADDLNYLLE